MQKVMTLDRFLIQRAGVSEDLARVIRQIALAGKIISNHTRRAGLEDLLGATGKENVQGEKVKKLDELGNEIFIRSFEYVGVVGTLVSEEMEKPLVLSPEDLAGDYIVLVDPVDGSSNLGIGGAVGSIFSVRRRKGSTEESILGRGTEQVAAGYVMYGTSTRLVCTAGEGVHSFVLDGLIGEFVLEQQGLRMPTQGKVFCANLGNYVRWTGPTKKFSDSLVGEGYSLRYSGALVGDLHGILRRGGVYFYPEDEKRPAGKLRLLYECAPVAMIAEQAGGAATTGKIRVMEIQPEATHQRIPFAVGSRYEVSKYEEEHH